MAMKNIAIFASGGGSNAVKMIQHFQQKNSICVKFIVTNNPAAGVINKAKELGIPTFVFPKEILKEPSSLIELLQKNAIDLIVLAGYLLKIPTALISKFPKSIVNIHPALLPNFGGKGMHGLHVHEAVIKAGKLESGITIHFVNEAYDEGEIIFQEKCKVETNDTPESLAARVLQLEHRNYATVVEQVLLSK